MSMFSLLDSPSLTDALGSSEVFLAFQDHLALVTDSERPVLILGERGTGKELAAQRLHYRSRRWEKPFTTLLCSALNPNLLEAELFGYEAGAFTGARERRIGYFERAHGGTLFLDEVADMPLPLQDKLLRILEYGQLTRVGGTTSIHVDVRLVAATNKPVEQLAADGLLRPDLLDRLACEVLHVPPLREREDDCILLACSFANKMAIELGSTVFSELPETGVQFSEQTLQTLRTYAWPGNIRELKNVIERSLLRTKGACIEELVINPYQAPWQSPMRPANQMPSHVPSHVPSHAASSAALDGQGAQVVPQSIPAQFSLPKALEAFELRALQTAMHQARHKQTHAARLLGLSYHQFRALYKKVRAQYPDTCA